MLNFKSFLYENYAKIAYKGLPKRTLDVLHKAKTFKNDVTHFSKLFDRYVYRGTKTGNRPTGVNFPELGRGSSRVAYELNHHHEIILDGKKTKIPVVLKVAKSERHRYGLSDPKEPLAGLDKHYGKQYMNTVGELQQLTETRPQIQQKYATFIKQKDGSYKTNPNAVVPTVFHRDPNGRFAIVEKVHQNTNNSRTASFAAGSDIDMHVRNLEYKYFNKKSKNEYIKSIGDPFIRNSVKMFHEHNIHPGDIGGDNSGISIHPHTKKKTPVHLDIGFSNHISQEFYGARS